MKIKDLTNGRIFDDVQEAKSHAKFSGNYEIIAIKSSEIYVDKLTKDRFYSISSLASANEMSSAAMTRLLAKGDRYVKGSGPRLIKARNKEVRCIETGQLFPSAASAAAHFECSHSLMGHVLSGRQKTAKGYHFEYTGRHTGTATRVRKKRIIRDDNGVQYDSIKALADAKGLTDYRARYIINKDREGIFRNAWLLRTTGTETRRLVIARYTVNDVPVGASKRQIISYIQRNFPHVPIMTVYKAVDRQLPVAIYLDATGWKIEPSGDLMR